MPLPAPWVDRIFDKLSVVYGHQFMGRWAGIPVEAVKADWAHELSALEANPSAIKFALENLPPSAPPTVLEFRALCSRRPDVAPPALPARKGDLKRLAAALSGITFANESIEQKAARCLAHLKQLRAEGVASPGQLDFLRRVEANRARRVFQPEDDL